jgi:predicted transposase YbfD/YdcC
MGTMSNYYGYRALGDFVKRHREALIELLSVPKERVPSYSTIRRVMLGIDFQDLIDAFNRWSIQYTKNEREESKWLAVDGKSIKGTVTNSSSSSQNFISLVSVYSQEKGIVVNCQQFESKTGSEIKTVQALLEGLDLQGMTFTLDALHCQKKTTEIIVNSGNDYVIAVKGNQPELLAQVEAETQKNEPASQVTNIDNSHGRKVVRTVEVYEKNQEVNRDWKGIKTFIKVTRSGRSEASQNSSIFYYISSKMDDEESFCQRNSRTLDC